MGWRRAARVPSLIESRERFARFEVQRPSFFYRTTLKDLKADFEDFHFS
jgi:hypothetical protein